MFSKHSTTIVAGDGGVFKICGRCGGAKTSSSFGRHSGRIDGLSPLCRECIAARGKKYYAENKDKVKAANDGWKNRNPDKAAARRRRFREENPGYDLQWRLDNIDAVRAGIRARGAASRLKPKVRLDNAMSCGIRGSLVRGAKAGTKWEKLVGYSVDDLMRHLERQFQPGMTWGNYGRGGWHVDHKIPKSLFNYESPDHLDFKRAWALDNLQPLWQSENCSKSDRFSGKFQPSLAL